MTEIIQPQNSADLENDSLLKDLLDILEPTQQERFNPDVRLSLCMIVKDEEEFIENCLKSVQNVVDEIIIVDTGSTDNTVEIAKKYTDKIFYHQWEDDFSAVRNESIKHATGDWILILDADEELSQEGQKNLRLLLTKPIMPTYFQLLIKNLKSSEKEDFMEHYMVRLFSNFYSIKYSGKIHEQLTPMAYYPILISEDLVFIYHYGYKNEIIEKKEKLKTRNPLFYKELSEEELSSSFNAFNISNAIGNTNIQESIKYLKSAIDKMPLPFIPPYAYVAYWRLIQSLVIICEYDEAIEVAEKVLKDAPNIAKFPDFWDHYACAYLFKKNYLQAIEYFKKAIESRNSETAMVFNIGRTSAAGSWASWNNMGMAYWHLEDFIKAKECLLKTLELKPNNISFYWKAVTACLKCSDYNMAGKLYNSMLELAPAEKNKIYSRLSNLYLRQEKVEDALKIQKDLYDEHIVKTNALKLAENYERGNRFDLALQVYSSLINFFPDYMEPYCKKAELYRDLGQPVDAMRIIETAKQNCVKKQDTDSMSKVAAIFLSLKQIISAEDCLKWILDINPDDYEANLYMAYIVQIKEDSAQAQRILENLIISNPKEVKAYIQLGNLLVGLKNFVYAEKILKQATELKPSSYYTHYGLGIAQLSLGKFAQANASLRIALKIKPDDQNIKNALELMYRNN